MYIATGVYFFMLFSHSINNILLKNDILTSRRGTFLYAIGNTAKAAF